MNRTVVLTLLCILAVVAISTTTACKSVISGGSSGAPPEEPGHYVKIPGQRWEKIPSDRLSSLQLADAERVAVSLPSNCKSVIYGYRMTREEVDFRFSGGPWSSFDPGQIQKDVTLSAASIDSSYSNRLDYISDSRNGGDTGKTNTSEGYVVVEFQLPSSPSGWYCIYPMITASTAVNMGRHIFLKRR